MEASLCRRHLVEWQDDGGLSVSLRSRPSTRLHPSEHQNHDRLIAPLPSASVARSRLLTPPVVVPSPRQDSAPAASSSTPPSSVPDKQQPQPSALPAQPSANFVQHLHTPEMIFALVKDLGNAFLHSYMGRNANG
ncbi:uncharacterized protein FIBRA_05552 [Fibroporia radiculosa]|uniref:Uncharacterized protein n=1 Tax=Fibroporia radiculosa TaxID=599839 RepID=J4IAS5_9APHY|nr:uncharacterized protein FIBRA_05552 [Fibroporia radiculosa]CCM03421.1 predicted protein [Fibroporia radiculosa]